jgi:cytochrome c551
MKLHPAVTGALFCLATLTSSWSQAQSLSAAGEGRRLYLKLNCYGCHGSSAQGGGMGPNIREANLGNVADAMREGAGGGMRAYSTYVNATDTANIAAYIASIGTPSEPKFKDWWVPVPPK